MKKFSFNKIVGSLGQRPKRYKEKHSHIAEQTNIHWTLLLVLFGVFLLAVAILSYILYVHIDREILVPPPENIEIEREDVAWGLLEEIIQETADKEVNTLRVLTDDPSMSIPSL